MGNFFLLLIDFYDFISLVFASIEKIHQALEDSVSSAKAMQTSRQKYSAARRISQLSSRCFDVPMKHVLLPNTILLSLLSIQGFYKKKSASNKINNLFMLIQNHEKIVSKDATLAIFF